MPWHYLENGKIVGPISDKDFEALREALDPACMVWRDGMKEWQRLESVPLEHHTGDVKRRHLTRARKSAEPESIQAAPPALIFTSPYAGFGSRLGAFLIDKAIFVIGLGSFAGGAWSTAGMGNLQWNYYSGNDWRSWMVPTLSGMALVALQFAYEVLMTAEFEATLGKMAFGLKVRHNGERLTYPRSAARVLCKKLIELHFLLYLGYLMILWDKEKRALHDHICSTHVFKA